MKRMLMTLIGIIILVILSTPLFAQECGDVNADGKLNLLDISYIINHLYRGGPEPICDGLKDVDGNIYQTVRIGTQVWMTENLKVTHYRNGDAIPNVTDEAIWDGLTTEAYCEYNNDINNVATYGRLYNWYAVNDSRNIAPVGWHVPTDAEWQTLIDYLCDSTVAGGKMKETGSTHWRDPNIGATNESGFSALPGGCRCCVSACEYVGMGTLAFFWSSTASAEYYGEALHRTLEHYTSVAHWDTILKGMGFSIRCVKD